MKMSIDSSEKMKKSRKDAKIAFIAAVASILALAVVVSFGTFAAFLGAGHKKGVAVARGYNFNSNILTSIVNEDSALNTYYHIENSTNTQSNINVQIRNFDSAMIPNPFEVTYSLKVKLDEPDTNNIYTYTLEYTNDSGNPVTIPITSAQWTTIGNDYTLKADEPDFDSYNIIFDRGTNPSDITKAASVCLIAVPNMPQVMSSYMLGAKISLTQQDTEFRADGEFISTADVSDLGGFVYKVTTSGVIKDANTKKITVSWNSDMLELDKNSKTAYSDRTDVTSDSGTTSSIVVEVESGASFNLVFYRTAKLAALANDVTRTELNGFVSIAY